MCAKPSYIPWRIIEIRYAATIKKSWSNCDRADWSLFLCCHNRFSIVVTYLIITKSDQQHRDKLTIPGLAVKLIRVYRLLFRASEISHGKLRCTKKFMKYSMKKLWPSFNRFNLPGWYCIIHYDGQLVRQNGPPSFLAFATSYQEGQFIKRSILWPVPTVLSIWDTQ